MKKRVISAIVALAVIIPLIVLGGYWYYVGIGIVGVIGFYELISIKEKKKNIPIVMKLLSMISFVLIMFSSINNNYQFQVDYIYLTLPLVLCLMPIVFFNKEKEYVITDALYLIGSVFLLGIAFNFLIVFRSFGLNYFIYLILITIMSDTFAHFVGSQIGKYKLCPSVSPNKTIEGLIGGTFFATFIGTIFYLTFIDSSISLPVVIIMTLVLSLSGAIGDLIFSAIKRYFGVKDFGNIMPGHGGVLDRLDSVLFAGLVMSIIVTLL